MAKKTDEIITQTEFAKRVGVSEAAIRKAVKAGHIAKGWFRNTDDKPRIRYETALVEWHEYKAGQGVIPSGQQTKNGVIDPKTPGEQPPAETIPTGESLASLKRKHEKIKLASAAHDLQVKKGNYVEKTAVYSALFSAGQEVRQALENVADRVIDEILSAPNRNEAHNVLSREINQALETLSGLGSVLDKDDGDETK